MRIYAVPALTTIDRQGERLGETVMKKLLAALGGAVDAAFTPIVPQLIVRAATLDRR